MVRMMQESATATERRESQRFRISAPLTLIVRDREIPAYTRDLSNRGAYFYLSSADSAQIDGEFEFIVELPPEITLSTCCRIRCKGRLARKEKSSRNMAEVGIAAEILEYSILREAKPAD
jgi:hypothetical protein